MFLVSCFLSIAHGAASGDAVIASLLDDTGWNRPSTSKGVTVHQKTVAGLPVPAFRGSRTVDVSCDAYFAVVSDPGKHKSANSMLRESQVLSRNGDTIVFYQVLDLPLLSDRYWINRAVNQRDLGGEAGHHRQTWQAEAKDAHPTVRDDVEDRFGAVFTELNYGYWDLLPAGQDRCTVTYAVVSDPGGNVPSSAGSWASEKSLPDNINGFLAAAKR